MQSCWDNFGIDCHWDEKSVEKILLWNPPAIFRFSNLPLEIPGKPNHSSYKLYQIVPQLNEIKNPTLEIWQYSFLIIPENSTFSLINLWKFDLLFLQYPWKFHLLTHPLLPVRYFSFNRPFFLMAHCKEIYLPHPAAFFLLAMM